MAGTPRIARLAGDMDDVRDQWAEDVAMIARALSDRVVTDREWEEIGAAMDRTRHAMDGIANGIGIVGDQCRLARQALASDGVTDWVVRSAREKGADYERLTEGQRPANVTMFPTPIGEPKPAA